MHWLPALALFLGLSGSAQAFTLFEVEPNDCFCEATPGGTAQTTAISGFLSDGEEDYYRFDFSGPVAYFSISVSSPDIIENSDYREFDLGLFTEIMTEEGLIEFPIDVCYDCWFSGGIVEAYDLPAGTYYVGVADFFGTISNDEPQPGPVNGLGLGAYTLSVNAIAVPEPGSLALLGAAVAGLALRRRR